jgi:hypothetical protein
MLTANGRLSLAPSMSRKGDIIGISHGARAPYVLRPNEYKAGFWLVGQAYVSGIISSECLKEEVMRFEENQIY